MRALWISLGLLGFTAVLQAIVVVWSVRGVAGRHLHNVADALTAIPLAIAFLIGRRPAPRRYTYGYGRAEDVAGIVIVAVIAASAVAAGWAAVDRLLHPADVSYVGAVAAAAVVGFVGNEAVAQLRIRVGRRIGSAALVADGLHARADGYTSLAVLLSAAGVALGWRWADPVVGILITLAILVVLRDAAREATGADDAVDPATVGRKRPRDTDGINDVGSVGCAGSGTLRAAARSWSTRLTVIDAHRTPSMPHRLLHSVPRLAAVIVHADPEPHAERTITRIEHHRLTGRS
jgi:divalent metal cation (Fe/Co/Zn/Cd) transporter